MYPGVRRGMRKNIVAVVVSSTSQLRPASVDPPQLGPTSCQAAAESLRQSPACLSPRLGSPPQQPPHSSFLPSPSSLPPCCCNTEHTPVLQRSALPLDQLPQVVFKAFGSVA